MKARLIVTIGIFLTGLWCAIYFQNQERVTSHPIENNNLEGLQNREVASLATDSKTMDSEKVFNLKTNPIRKGKDEDVGELNQKVADDFLSNCLDMEESYNASPLYLDPVDKGHMDALEGKQYLLEIIHAYRDSLDALGGSLEKLDEKIEKKDLSFESLQQVLLDREHIVYDCTLTDKIDDSLHEIANILHSRGEDFNKHPYLFELRLELAKVAFSVNTFPAFLVGVTHLRFIDNYSENERLHSFSGDLDEIDSLIEIAHENYQHDVLDSDKGIEETYESFLYYQEEKEIIKNRVSEYLSNITSH